MSLDLQLVLRSPWHEPPHSPCPLIGHWAVSGWPGQWSMLEAEGLPMLHTYEKWSDAKNGLSSIKNLVRTSASFLFGYIHVFCYLC